MLARVQRTFRELPLLMRAGLLLASLGGVMDVGYHLATTSEVAHGSVAFVSHMVTLTGMVVTMVGLIGAAFRRRPVEVKTTTKGVDR